MQFRDNMKPQEKNHKKKTESQLNQVMIESTPSIENEMNKYDERTRKFLGSVNTQ